MTMAMAMTMAMVVTAQDYYGPHPDTCTSSERVLLKNVRSLVFHAGRWTTARRSAPIAQMMCSGRHCSSAPSSMICRNIGTDNVDVIWQCEGDLPNHLRFVNTVVSCEGYDYANDPFVLAGSCGVSFLLKRVAVYNPYNQNETMYDLLWLLSWLMIIVFIFYFSYHAVGHVAHGGAYFYDRYYHPGYYHHWRTHYCGPRNYFPDYYDWWGRNYGREEYNYYYPRGTPPPTYPETPRPTYAETHRRPHRTTPTTHATTARR